MQIQGVLTAIVTPFKNREVDYDGLKRNLAFQIESGIDGIVAIGTTGEAPTLTEEEQVQIIKISREMTKGKIPLIVGTGSNSTEHTIELTKQAERLGADAALIVAPYYNRPSQQGIFQHFKAITEATKLPIIIYNVSKRTGVNIEPATVAKLAEIPSIIGIKECESTEQVASIIQLVKPKRAHFAVLSGNDDASFATMALGADGLISVASNLYPQPLLDLVHSFLKKQPLQEARDLHYYLLPLLKNLFLETNPVPVKAAMNACGMAAGPVRLPLCEMSHENHEKLIATLKQYGLISLDPSNSETLIPSNLKQRALIS